MLMSWLMFRSAAVAIVRAALSETFEVSAAGHRALLGRELGLVVVTVDGRRGPAVEQRVGALKEHRCRVRRVDVHAGMRQEHLLDVALG
jgi:hypothetical protein